MAYADLSADRTAVDVITSWNEGELVKAVPGSRWDSRQKRWKLRLTWGACVALRGAFRDDLIVGDALQAWAWDARERLVDPALRYRDLLELPNDGGTFEEHLYPFQRAGVAFLRTADGALLADDMGCGKTIQVLSALLDGRLEDPLPALVVCPNSVKRHWWRHIARRYTNATPYSVEGSAAARRKILAEAADDPTAVVILNIESARLFSRLAPYGSVRLKRCVECDKRYGDEKLTSARCEVHAKELNGFGFRTAVIDEAHRVKDPKSKQTRAIWALFHDESVRYRWALTGTPVAQHPGDLWSIMHAICPDEFPTRGKFIDRYCLVSWNAFGGTEIVGVRPDTRDELFSFLDPHLRRMLKDVVLPQLPPKVRQTRWVELPAAQLKMYRQLEERLLARDANGRLLVAPTQLAKQTRLMQLASATVAVENVDDDPESWVVRMKSPSPKVDELELVLEELGEARCVVAAESKQLINLAAERLDKLGVRHALITGDVSEYDRDRALQWLEEGKIRCLLFTVKAGGVGLDMSPAGTIVNLQRSWSLVEHLQTEDRVRRIGSERHEVINVIDIVTRDTCEEDQIERLAVKLEKLEQIVRDRAQLAKLGRDTSHLDAAYQQLLATHLGLPDQEEEAE